MEEIDQVEVGCSPSSNLAAEQVVVVVLVAVAVAVAIVAVVVVC